MSVAAKRKLPPINAAKPRQGEVCLECRMGSSVYVACGKPAAYVVENRGEVVPMCAADADHNVSNRGSRYLLDGEARPDLKDDDLLGADQAQEIEEAPPPTESELAKVVELAKSYWSKQNEIEKTEALLSKLKEELVIIREVELPSAMLHVGVRDLGLANGWRVELKKIIAGNITADKKPDAFAWLENNGFADLIKRVVVVSFGRDESSWAKKFLRDMAQRKKPLRAEIDEKIAPQTFQKFIRDQVAAAAVGAIPPEKVPPKELFGIFEKTVALLEGPKK